MVLRFFPEFQVKWTIVYFISLLALGFVIFAYILGPIGENLEEDYGESVVQPEIEKFFSNVNYVYNEGIEEEFVNQSKLFPSYDLYAGKHYFSGKVNRHVFSFSSVALYHEETYTDDNDIQQIRSSEILKASFLYTTLNTDVTETITLKEKAHEQNY